LAAQPDEFRPVAVYNVPWVRILDWIVATAIEIPEQPAKKRPPIPNLADPASPMPPPMTADWDHLLQLTSSRANPTVYAWRAPPLDQSDLDLLFPVPPADKVAKRALRHGAEDVSPDFIAEVLFILEPQ
jgi:hypothetical protein